MCISSECSFVTNSLDQYVLVLLIKMIIIPRIARNIEVPHFSQYIKLKQ